MWVCSAAARLSKIVGEGPLATFCDLKCSEAAKTAVEIRERIQQPRDPQHSEGGAEESSGPPTSYKTRGRRKHSDNRHTWSKEAGTEKDLEREANREQET
ncbi:hypothetical protein KUCAC02_013669, partial [Chaenocephalus aceratus]